MLFVLPDLQREHFDAVFWQFQRNGSRNKKIKTDTFVKALENVLNEAAAGKHIEKRQMKMTAYDRLEATKRCPECLKYQEALLKIAEETDPEKKLSLLGKVRFPLDHLELYYLSLLGLPGFDEIKKELLERFEREAVVLLNEFGDDPIEGLAGLPRSTPTGGKRPRNRPGE